MVEPRPAASPNPSTIIVLTVVVQVVSSAGVEVGAVGVPVLLVAEYSPIQLVVLLALELYRADGSYRRASMGLDCPLLVMVPPDTVADGCCLLIVLSSAVLYLCRDASRNELRLRLTLSWRWHLYTLRN